MIQYTTPTLPLEVKGVDLTPYEVYVSIAQSRHELELHDVEVTYDSESKVTTILVALTQEQTGSLRPGKAKVQVNWVDQVGKRNATTIREVDVLSNLLDRVVEYGSD